MSNSTETSNSFNSLDDILNDPKSLEILNSVQPEEQQETKASDEVPALLREQARKLTTEPFTGNPPHHGVSAEETLNTSLIRRFSGISYDLVSNELVKETETGELSNLLSKLETFDVAKFEEELAAKKLAEQQAKAAKLEAQQSQQTTQASDPLPKPTKPESTDGAVAKNVQEQTQIAEVDVAFGLSPTLFLMSGELTGSQKLLYSTVYDFISLHHRIPKSNAGGNEAQAAMFLKTLYEELPLASSQLLKHFIGVLPAEDVELVKSQYSGNHPRQDNEVEEAKADSKPAEVENNSSNEQALKETEELELTKAEISGATFKRSAEDTNSSIDQTLKKAEEQDLTKDTDSQSETQDTTDEPALSLDQVLKEAKDLGLTDDFEPLVKLQPRAYVTSTNIKQSSSADGQVARFQKCPNFVQYSWIFDEIKKGLTPVMDATGEKSANLGWANVTGKGNSRKIRVGDVFCIKNTFYLIADIESEQTYITKHDKEQARILVITDDGKQSTPFDTSFASRFDKEATQRVIACNDQGFQLEHKIKNYCFELLRDKPVKGYVYVLRTKSQNPVLLNYMQNSELLKIGFSTQPIAKRIANADKETTFLEAPVEVLYYVECHNYNPHTFEQLIHQVLDKRRLNIKLKSLATGKIYQPKEWFTVGLDVAREVIDRIMDGSIFNYHLNPINGRLVLGPQNS